MGLVPLQLSELPSPLFSACGHPGLGRPAPRTVKNKFPLFISHLVYGIVNWLKKTTGKIRMNSIKAIKIPTGCPEFLFVPFLAQVHSQAWSCLLFPHPALEGSRSITHSAKSTECLLRWRHAKQLEHNEEQNSGIWFSCALSLWRQQALIEYSHMDEPLWRKSMECVRAKGKCSCYLPLLGAVLPPKRSFGNLWEHFVCPHKWCRHSVEEDRALGIPQLRGQSSPQSSVSLYPWLSNILLDVHVFHSLRLELNFILHWNRKCFCMILTNRISQECNLSVSWEEIVIYFVFDFNES